MTRPGGPRDPHLFTSVWMVDGEFVVALTDRTTADTWVLVADARQVAWVFAEEEAT